MDNTKRRFHLSGEGEEFRVRFMVRLDDLKVFYNLNDFMILYFISPVSYITWHKLW